MGSSSNNAQATADANEAARQKNITDSTQQINSIFDSPDRQKQYTDLGSDTTKFYDTDLDRQKAINDRKLKFSLARSGNVGGSLQADQSQTLGQDYSKGLVEDARRGQQAAAGLRSSDEQTRMNLLASAQTGIDATTAASQATSALQGNLQSSQAGATANGLGDAFADLGSVYNASEQQRQFHQGLAAYSQQSPYYKPLYGAPNATQPTPYT